MGIVNDDYSLINWGGAIYQISLKPKKNKIEINGGKYLGSYGTTVITLYKS